MTKELTGPSLLRFQTAQPLDVSSVVPALANTLIRGLHPKCICFHPTKPLFAVGVSGYIAVYDVQSNTRLGRVDLKSVPVEMAFAPDGSVIIVVVQDWILYSVSTSSWKVRMLVPRRAKMDKPLERCLLAVAPGHNPLIYFARYAKDTLRLATLPGHRAGGAAASGGAGGADGADAAGGRGGRASSGWGSRVKLDVQKPILALACHVVDAQLLLLTSDGVLRGYAIAGGGGDVLSPLYAVGVAEPADKAVPPPGLLTCVPHPSVPGGALVLQGSIGGAVAALEAPGRGPPTPLLRTRVPGWVNTVGLGVEPLSNTLLAFGLSEGGRLRCSAWRLSYRHGAVGVALRPSRVEPQDLTPLLDSNRRARAALASGMAAGAATAAALAAGGATGYSSGAGSAVAGDAPPAGAASQRGMTLGGGAGGVGGAAGGATPLPAWHGLWSVGPAWAHDASSSCLLESQLGPHVRRVLVHPSLGLLAAASEPALGAALNREIMFSGRGELAAEEVALARRTAQVSLLHVANLESHAGGWRGARAAPQHTPLAAWLPPQLAAAPPPAPMPAVRAAGDSSDDDGDAAAAAAAPAGAAGSPGPAGAGGGGGGAGDGSLTLPPHVYYLAGNRLMKYSLVTRTAGTLVQLPTDAPDGDTRMPRQLLHSARAGAWLVFFESASSSAAAAAAAAANGGGGMNSTAGGAVAVGPERFSWTLVNAAALGRGTEGGAAGAPTGLVTWVRPGKCGCFLGPDDAHFAVMSANGRLLEVFDTAAAAPLAPLLTLTLEGGVLLPAAGLGAPIFPGPPMTNAPVPEARAPPEAPPHDARRFRGLGVVLWQSPDCSLSATTLPALTRVPLDAPAPDAAAVAPSTNDSSSDDDDGAAAAAGAPQPYYATLPAGHHFGSLPRQASLPLLPGENVIHVAWQSLAPPAATAAADGPADAVAAVLTSQRLLLVTAGLRLVCAASLATHGSAAVPEPLTSVVWAGPMLLASTAAGQVLQMTWTGSLLPLATVSPTGHTGLVGVTADVLLLLRTPLGAPPAAAAAAAAAGNAAAAAALAEVVTRPAVLLQPLIIGWASLAATGLLSYGPCAGIVRPALRHALASFDAASVTPRGVWALIAAGACDVAAAVAAHMPPLDSSVRLAAAAAAGNWSSVAAALAGEASRALHAPAPPPRGSELHSKLVAAAAGALFHGQLTAAGELFQAAGEWPPAMILAVCSGNVQNVSAIAGKLAGAGGAGGAQPTAPDAAVAGQLATALRSVYGAVGSPVGDLTLSLSLPGAEAEPLERADRWPLATGQPAPAAVTVLGALPRAAVTDAELGAIPPAAAAASPLPYYGLTLTAASAVSTAAAAAAARVAAAEERGGAAGAASFSGAESSSHKPGGSTAAGDFETASVASSDAAQAAARAEFLNHAGAGMGGFGRRPTMDFSSDDDSGSEATGSAADTLGGGSGGRRIKIQIRDRGSAAAAGPTGGDGALREAAKGLRLAPPGAATAAAGGGGSRLALGTAASGAFGAASPGGPPAGPPAGATAGGGSPPVQFPPGMSSAQLYAGGVAAMQAGDWRAAAAHFSRAMSVLQHDERAGPAALDEASRRARLSFCAAYYAAVRLLEGVGTGVGRREARLYRYLAGLRLDPTHATALLREAITRNRAAGNYRYAADQLTALIGRVADTAPGDYLAQLQAEIEECDRHGGANADVPADEQVDDWAALVVAVGDSAGGKEDVDALVLPLLA